MPDNIIAEQHIILPDSLGNVCKFLSRKFDCLINDNIPSVGIEDAVKSIRIAEAVKNSYKENKKIELKNLN